MKLRIAIQKSGRLHEDSIKLLKECGIDINNGVNKLKTEATNFPLEVFFLRDDDIPQYVEDGVADIGMVGENVVLEKNRSVKVATKLGFGKCRLSLAVPRAVEYNGVKDMDKLRIATSYPVILENFLKENGITADIHEISGSVEIAPGIGLADAICDLVSSGSTLFMNGLK
jgi:ATP phosphoribosyltransferase